MVRQIPPPTSIGSDLTALSAVDLAALIAVGEVSAREAVNAYLERIEQWNPLVNALCTVTAEKARREAAQLDDLWARGEVLGPLHGVPIVHKDLLDTAGVRTTYGSMAFAEHIPTVDNVSVSRIRKAGAIMLGKSNTPQFGTGGHTANALFGTTVNPHHLERSAGGSSGGSAAALAANFAPLATGTDMAGSLRIPAAFCGVVGMRPSPGVVPWAPTHMSWFPYITAGPMARSVDDAALLMCVMAGDEPGVPLAAGARPWGFIPPLPRDRRGGSDSRPWKVAWAPTLAGLPVDADVSVLLNRLPSVMSGMDIELTEAQPDLHGAQEAFWTWRCWYYATAFADILEGRPEVIDDSTRLTIEKGLALTGAEIGRAERERSHVIRTVADFFDEFDVLLVPSAPVTAFDAESWWPADVGGSPMRTYADWMRHFYFLTAAAVPAMSLPIGKSPSGLPVGVQVVAGNRCDRDVFAFAGLLETVLGGEST